jgi:hypothetical protein
MGFCVWRNSNCLVKVQVEGIKFLDAAISHQEWSAIPGQSYPRSENISALRKILETQNVLQYAIFDSHACQFCSTTTVFAEADIGPVRKPLVVADLFPLDPTRPLARGSVENPQFRLTVCKCRTIATVRGNSRRVQSNGTRDCGDFGFNSAQADGRTAWSLLPKVIEVTLKYQLYGTTVGKSGTYCCYLGKRPRGQ